jgi:hypothetical protein
MAGQKKHNEIVFVNSFKGGAGKTTLSLTHCIDDLFHEQKFENVIYIDLDILGTATSYLFDKDKLPLEKCFNHTKKAVRVDLDYEGETKGLHVLYLSPELKTRSIYKGINYINNQDIAQQLLRDDITAFVRERVEGQEGNLIVFDCAPGFSKMEQELLKTCYDMKLARKTQVREEYVATLDSGHIEKCVQCLADSWKTFQVQPDFRNIRLTLNDIQNYYSYANRDPKSDAEQQFQEIAETISARLQEEQVREVEIFFWRYSQDIAVHSVFRHQRFVENQVDCYILTQDSYKKYQA